MRNSIYYIKVQIMKSQIAKHWAGRGGNSPLCQEKSFGANIDIDKDSKSLNPSLRAQIGNFSANTGASVNPRGANYNVGLNYNKGGFHAGVGLSGQNKTKPNVTASIGYNKTF